ncbi:MAG: ABC transporter permease [Acidimicrobiia bacterium]
MFRIALKSVLSKKLRLFSTALSITLGVAFLAGTFVFSDTIRRTFDDLFADVYEHTDAYVRSSSTVDLGFGNTQRGRIPQSAVDVVKGVDGVADAQGIVQSFAQVVGSDGDAIGNPGQGAPTFGMNWLTGDQNPWVLTEGSREPGPNELVIDQGTAKRGDLHVGDTVMVLTQTGPHEFPLVGTARFGSADSPGGASASLFDLATAQTVLVGGTGEIDAVTVAAEPGVSQEELAARLTAVLPDGAEAATGQQLTEETQNTIRDAMSFFDTFLLVFACIALVVAGFTIYNTFQIIITQRTREMALLRSLGATRRQVLSAQLLEALLLGIFASIIGVIAGFFVAGALKALLGAVGIDIPASGVVLRSRTVIIALVVGTMVTAISAVFPSLRASRVPPLAAIRDVAIDQSGQSRRRLVLGAVETTAGLGGFVVGLTGSGLLWVGIGALLVFLGVFTLGPLIARPATRVLGAPLPAAAGITGDLARENAMRNPKRTARTGGALMVGVALVAAITIIAASAKDWTRDVFGGQFGGDFVVSTNSFGFGGLSPDVAAALNQLPEVDAAAGIRLGAAHDVAGDDDISYISVDPATASKVFDIHVSEGSLDALSVDGIFLFDDAAADRGLVVGDTFDVGFLDGTVRPLTVEGIYTEDALAGSFVISHALSEQTGTDQFDFSVYVLTAPGVDAARAEAAIAGISDAYPNADLQSRDEYIDAQAAQVDMIVNLMYGLLGLAVVIALISIANSIALSIHERTRELGLLRAVGMTRGQTRASVAWEAVLIALVGTVLGVVIGVFFGWSISVTLRGSGLGTFSMPVMPLVVIAVVAILGAVIAAIRPAWRAARLDVLRAISSE